MDYHSFLVYLLPSRIQFHGKLISVAELFASKYATLLSNAIRVSSYFNRGYDIQPSSCLYSSFTFG